MSESSQPAQVGSNAGLGAHGMPPRYDIVTRANPDTGGLVNVPVWCADDMLAFASAAVAAERERIALHFDARDSGPDGKPQGIGFYDPHEPAEIIRALGPNAGIERTRSGPLK